MSISVDVSPIAVETLLARPGAPVHVIERTEHAITTPTLSRIAQLAPWLTVIPARCGGPPCPRTRVEGRRPHGEITFVGPIDGRQLEPFVILLHELSSGTIDYETPATPALLAALSHGVALGLAVTATCPYCPALASTVLRLALATPRISVAIARADLGLAGDVRSVPTLRLDGDTIATGPISEYALAQRIAGCE